MKTIYLLLDYKEMFGTKRYATPYRSGMDKKVLMKYFNENGYDLKSLSFSDIDFRTMDFKKEYVLYTSSEDNNYHYKSYIEDICYALQLQGAILIPEYKYLRAHSNKVFMECLRDLSSLQPIKNIKSHHFGTMEELKKKKHMLGAKVVVKAAGGAMSKYVSLATNVDELLKQAAKVSRTRAIIYELWDWGRSLKHKGYTRESKYRNKFVVQNFVPDLPNDWKILSFGKKYYVLYRGTRRNDFRASGSGKFQFREDLPCGILDFAENVYDSFDVPNISIDVAFDGKNFYLVEFQAIYFGSTTIQKSPFYFTKNKSRWVIHKDKSIIEKEYVDSIVGYIKNKGK